MRGASGNRNSCRLRRRTNRRRSSDSELGVHSDLLISSASRKVKLSGWRCWAQCTRWRKCPGNHRLHATWPIDQSKEDGAADWGRSQPCNPAHLEPGCSCANPSHQAMTCARTDRAMILQVLNFGVHSWSDVKSRSRSGDGFELSLLGRAIPNSLPFNWAKT